MDMILSFLEALLKPIITFCDGVALLAESFVNTIPSGLVFLLIILLAASTFTLSKRCKQLNSIAETQKTIAKSFERQLDKLESAADAIEKSDS